MPYLVCSRCGLVVYSAAGLAAGSRCVSCDGLLEERDVLEHEEAPEVVADEARDEPPRGTGRFRRLGRRLATKDNG